jgi:hypothetical protein
LATPVSSLARTFTELGDAKSLKESQTMAEVDVTTRALNAVAAAIRRANSRAEPREGEVKAIQAVQGLLYDPRVDDRFVIEALKTVPLQGPVDKLEVKEISPTRLVLEASAPDGAIGTLTIPLPYESGPSAVPNLGDNFTRLCGAVGDGIIKTVMRHELGEEEIGDVLALIRFAGLQANLALERAPIKGGEKAPRGESYESHRDQAVNSMREVERMLQLRGLADNLQGALEAQGFAKLHASLGSSEISELEANAASAEMNTIMVKLRGCGIHLPTG